MSENLVAVIQLNSGESVAQNKQTIEKWVQQAGKVGAKLVLLPENCIAMSAIQGEAKKLAEPLGQGEVQAYFSKIAKENQLWLVVGAFPILDKGLVYQTSLVFDDCGELVAHYHKRHLFNVTLPDGSATYRESDAFSYGRAIRVVETPIGKVGLSICYDLRFPGHFQRLADAGAEILTVPAAFTYHTGKAHWATLLKARAIENQCYVIAAGQVGEHPGNRRTWGHSMIINPWGEVLADKATAVGLITAKLDIKELYENRHRFPTLEHRQDSFTDK